MPRTSFLDRRGAKWVLHVGAEGWGSIKAAGGNICNDQWKDFADDI